MLKGRPRQGAAGPPNATRFSPSLFLGLSHAVVHQHVSCDLETQVSRSDVFGDSLVAQFLAADLRTLTVAINLTDAEEQCATQAGIPFDDCALSDLPRTTVFSSVIRMF